MGDRTPNLTNYQNFIMLRKFSFIQLLKFSFNCLLQTDFSYAIINW